MVDFYYRDPQHREIARGPLTESQLQQAVADGRVPARFEISEDNVRWRPAAELHPSRFAETGTATERHPHDPEPDIQDSPVEPRTLRQEPVAGSSSTGAPAGSVWKQFRQWIGDLGRYYWSQREALWSYTVDAVPFLDDFGSVRELSIPRDSDSDRVHVDGDLWEVTLPKCCVVCGEPTESRRIAVTWQFARLDGPFWFPLSGLVAGLVLGWWYSSWLVLIALCAAGIALGYATRGEQTLRLSFRRCADHAGRTDLPAARLHRGTLIVSAGHRAVWNKFHESALTGASVHTATRSAAPLETLPLADDG
jgi:hypothetical protein